MDSQEARDRGLGGFRGCMFALGLYAAVIIIVGFIVGYMQR